MDMPDSIGLVQAKEEDFWSQHGGDVGHVTADDVLDSVPIHHLAKHRVNILRP